MWFVLGDDNSIIMNNMKLIDSKKVYKAPISKVVEVNVQGMLCQSFNGGFGVSNDGNVGKGDDSVWGEDLGW